MGAAFGFVSDAAVGADGVSRENAPKSLRVAFGADRERVLAVEIIKHRFRPQEPAGKVKIGILNFRLFHHVIGAFFAHATPPAAKIARVNNATPIGTL